jgi:hypothetical protein
LQDEAAGSLAISMPVVTGDLYFRYLRQYEKVGVTMPHWSFVDQKVKPAPMRPGTRFWCSQVRRQA